MGFSGMGNRSTDTRLALLVAADYLPCAMLEHTEFPYLPSGDPNRAVLALIQLCREMPPDGEQFRFFRSRVKGFRMWDKERVGGTLAFLGMERAGTMKPSRFVKSIRIQRQEEKAKSLLADRLWDVNPLLFKSVIELLKQQVYSRDEVIKHVTGFGYHGKKLTRPQLESWLHLALGLEILQMVGIALDIGPNAERFMERARSLDVEDYLEDMAAEADEAGADEAPTGAGNSASEPESEPDANVSGGDTATPAGAAPTTPTAAARAPSGGPGRAPAIPGSAAFLDVSNLASPLSRDNPTAIRRFVGQDVFADEVLAETSERIQTWWSEQSTQARGAVIDDFGMDANTWMEGAEEALYRIAVAAALVFRLGRDRDSVIQAFEGLDKAGVLGDLYYGTAPDELPENADPKALMLASLVARRCAEDPELASKLERQESAQAAFSVLDQALGRGFLRLELFWMMRALAELGALRHADLPGFSALPRRLVRDTLFRLGFIGNPYAHDAASLIPAAQAARRAVGSAEPPDEVLMSFALAAGCAYECGNRRQCQFACRERAE